MHTSFTGSLNEHLMFVSLWPSLLQMKGLHSRSDHCVHILKIRTQSEIRLKNTAAML